jgi:hypothetical protein
MRIPRPLFVRPAAILPRSNAESFARHRARFANLDFDLDEMNPIRVWIAFTNYKYRPADNPEQRLDRFGWRDPGRQPFQ